MNVVVSCHTHTKALYTRSTISTTTISATARCIQQALMLPKGDGMEGRKSCYWSRGVPDRWG